MWHDLGFAVDDSGACLVGSVRIALAGPGDASGIRSWVLHASGALPASIDGLATTVVEGGHAGASASAVHPNGTVALDHLVVTSHDQRRTEAALVATGFEPRRTLEMGDRRYTFFRTGDTILELIGPAEPDDRRDRPARFYGLAFTVDDLDATALSFGERLGPVKDALQPGRRIVTVRREAGATVPIAFMSPGPGTI